MEMLGHRGAFAAFIAKSLKDEDFVLVDVGCGGGIDGTWRVFGDHLAAVGFDPNIDEVERLQRAETSKKINYKAAFVGVPAENPISIRRGGRLPNSRNPWNRFAVNRTMSIMAEQIKNFSPTEKVEINAWPQAKLTEPDRLFLPDYLDQIGFGSVDFIKIDIDSDDYDVLQSLEESLSNRRILGLCAEVNFYGSDDPTEHTFHNTDRFMRKNGFDLFGLTTRSYSAAALPHRYELRMPAQSIAGRPYQGDALYLRDVGSEEWSKSAPSFGPEKLLKLAALFSLFGLPDCAAQVLVTYRIRLQPLINVDAGLDLLVAETDLGASTGMSYKELMAAFEANRDIFYPGNSSNAPAAGMVQSVAPAHPPAPAMTRLHPRRIARALLSRIAPRN
ncbi:FkbM family methyltransferase [Tardiphaga sp. 839_C3_N1_4]|jgi:hypothetical protein|uniref:FkbM family methyltransferase n=1 Tax=Tardiphaga sp. 839_C3_N1_4 TaxID=3240761 RepID=UPI003F219D3A